MNQSYGLSRHQKCEHSAPWRVSFRPWKQPLPPVTYMVQHIFRVLYSSIPQISSEKSLWHRSWWIVVFQPTDLLALCGGSHVENNQRILKSVISSVRSGRMHYHCRSDTMRLTYRTMSGKMIVLHVWVAEDHMQAACHGHSISCRETSPWMDARTVCRTRPHLHTTWLFGYPALIIFLIMNTQPHPISTHQKSSHSEPAVHNSIIHLERRKKLSPLEMIIQIKWAFFRADHSRYYNRQQPQVERWITIICVWAYSTRLDDKPFSLYLPVSSLIDTSQI